MKRYLAGHLTSLALSSATISEDMWDFGTVRNVHARPGTLRKTQATAMSGHPLPFADSAASIHHHFSSIHVSQQPAQNGAKSHGPSAPPAPLRERYPQPQSQTQPPVQALPPVPPAQPPHAQGQPSFDTIRQAPPPQANAPPKDTRDQQLQTSSSHGKPYATSSAQKPHEESAEQSAHEQSSLAGMASHENEEYDEDSGNIMHTVVLPVLDSVSMWSAYGPRSKGRLLTSCLMYRFMTASRIYTHATRFCDSDKRSRLLSKKFRA